ncbi:MAG: hypothetical protein KJ601_01895 [Nanoarchaeota archaeon]|nr:hypothetical protein [Nanoarchaeota archaeon]MBU1704633.1 hypothetical protein [Nanoarchaeota archaeon]
MIYNAKGELVTANMKDFELNVNDFVVRIVNKVGPEIDSWLSGTKFKDFSGWISVLMNVLWADAIYREVPKLTLVLEKGLPKGFGDISDADAVWNFIESGNAAYVDKREIDAGQYMIHLMMELFRYPVINVKVSRIMHQIARLLIHEMTNMLNYEHHKIKSQVRHQSYRLEAKINRLKAQIDAQISVVSHIKEFKRKVLEITLLLRRFIFLFQERLYLEGITELENNLGNLQCDKRDREHIYRTALDAADHFVQRLKRILHDFSRIEPNSVDRLLSDLKELLAERSYFYIIGLHVFYEIYMSGRMREIEKGSIRDVFRVYLKACVNLQPIICMHGNSAKYSFSDMIGKIHQARKKIKYPQS